jgi:hypothetical protein
MAVRAPLVATMSMATRRGVSVQPSKARVTAMAWMVLRRDSGVSWRPGERTLMVISLD